MIDTLTNEPLQVLNVEGGMPFISLQASQVEEVMQLLASHGVRHWRSESDFSFNGGPFTARIFLGKGGDAKAVQALLDSVS